MEQAYQKPPALEDTDLLNEAQQYDTLNPLRVTQGVVENLLSMGSMFAGSVPGFMKGVWEATRGLGNEDDFKAAGDRYVDNFLETQDFFTYEPRSVKGKKYRDALMHLFETWGEWGKKNISDPAFEAGYPKIAAWAQTSIEALPILLPLYKQVPFRGKATEPTPPVMRPKPAEPTVDVKMTFETEAPTPTVPRETIDLPKKADPMKPKPVEERTMADLEPSEPLEGIKVPDLPEISGELRPPAEYKEAPRPTREGFIEEEGFKEGLRPEEVIEAEKAEFGQEFDKLYPKDPKGPISKAEMEAAYGPVGKQGPVLTSSRLLDPDIIYAGFDRTGPVPTAKEVKGMIESEFPNIEAEVILFDENIVSGMRGDARFRIDFVMKPDPPNFRHKKLEEGIGKKIFDKIFGGKDFYGGTSTTRKYPVRPPSKIKPDPGDIDIPTKGDELVIKHLDPIRTPPETPIQEFPPQKPVKRWKAKGLDVQKDSLFDAIAKLGGLPRAEAEILLGIMPGQKLPTTVFGRPIFRKKGKAVDQMADELANEGYLDRDPVTGKVDPRQFEERFLEETHGRKQYSKFKQYDDDLFASEYEKYLKDQMKDKGPDGPTFNTGIPTEQIKTFIKKANQGIRDALGIPEKGVAVTRRPKGRREAIIGKALLSPSKLVGKVKHLRPVFEMGRKAERTEFRYRKMFNERRRVIRQLLGGGFISKAGKLLGAEKRGGVFVYNKNIKEFHSLRMASELRGKYFSPKELREMGVSEEIVKAYTLNKSLYETMWKLEVKHLKARGLPIPDYVKGYVPHYFRDWFIRDKRTGDILDTASTEQKAVKLANEISRETGIGELEIYPRGKHFEGEEIQSAIIGDQRYYRMMKKLEQRFKFTPKEMGKLLGDIFKKGPKSKVFENLMDRLGVSGWVKDLDYVDNRYTNMLARYLAQDEFALKSKDYFETRIGEFDKDWGGDTRYVKNYINDVLGVPTKAEKMMDALIEMSPALDRLAKKYMGPRPAYSMANNISMAATVLKLGLWNSSSAMVNLTQLTNVYAKLGERAFLEGGVRFMRVKKDLVAHNYKWLEMVKKPNSDIWILKELGIADQLGFSGVEGFSPGGFVKGSLILFREVEFINRSVAVLGAFHKFMRQNKNLPLKERRTKALEYAEKINDQANFNYAAVDAISFMRQSGPPGHLGFKFWPFFFKELDFMKSLKGAENARFWIPWLVLAGYMGAPFVQDISDLAEQATGTNVVLESKKWLMTWVEEEEDDQERAKRKRIADIAMYGIASQLGIDPSYRLATGEVSNLEVGGVIVSTFIRPLHDLWKGEIAKALGHFATSPGKIADAVRGVDPRDPKGRRKIKFTGKDRFFGGMGFKPLPLAQETDKARIMNYKKRQKREEERDLIKEYLDAVDDKDSEKMSELTNEILRRNIDWERVVRERVMRDYMTQSERAFYNLPGKDRPEAYKYFTYGRERE